MKRKILVTVLTIVALLTLTVGCGSSDSGGSTETASGETIEWDFFTFYPLTDDVAIIMQDFCDEIYEETDGGFKIVMHPEGELPYTGAEAYRVIKDGSVEMSDVCTGYVTGDSPLCAIVAKLYLITSLDEWKTAVEVLDPWIQDEMDEYNAVLMIPYIWQNQYFWGKGDPVYTYEDLKGKTLRTYSIDQQEFLNACGGIPVTLTLAEVPGAFQRGVIEGIMTSALSCVNTKLYEEFDWGFLSSYGISNNFIICNKDAYNALPEEYQELLMEKSAKYTDILDNFMVEDEANKIKIIEDAGVEVVRPSDEVKAQGVEIVKPQWEAWYKEQNDYYKEAFDTIREALGK